MSREADYFDLLGSLGEATGKAQAMSIQLRRRAEVMRHRDEYEYGFLLGVADICDEIGALLPPEMKRAGERGDG